MAGILYLELSVKVLPSDIVAVDLFGGDKQECKTEKLLAWGRVFTSPRGGTNILYHPDTLLD